MDLWKMHTLRIVVGALVVLALYLVSESKLGDLIPMLVVYTVLGTCVLGLLWGLGTGVLKLAGLLP